MKPLIIGQCIYCGATKTELTDEHIVPFGFGNTKGDILYKASCKKCAEITSKFEGYILRSVFQDVRTVMQLKSHHRKQPQSVKQRVIFADGRSGELDVPFNKFKSMLALPIFNPPSATTGNHSRSDCEVQEIQFINIGNTDRDDWYKLQGVEQFHAKAFAGNKDHSYEKFIIKIAYCAAVKIYGYDIVKNSPIPKLLLGYDNRYATWLGNMEHNYFEQKTSNSSWLRYRVEEVERGLIASVQFFAALSESPIYNVIVLEKSDE